MSKYALPPFPETCQKIRTLSIGLIVGAVCLGAAGTATAQLKPDEVAIVANRKSERSLELAKYYAHIRQIPEANIFSLDFPESETMDRTTWESQIRPAIRDWLNRQSDPSQIRCLVTTWDVPLRIGQWQENDELLEWTKFHQVERTNRLNRIYAVMERLHEIGQINEEVVRDSQQGIADLHKRCTSLVGRVGDFVSNISDETERQEKQQILQAAMSEFSGLQPLVQGLDRYVSQNLPNAAEARSQLDFLRGRGAAFEEAVSLMLQMLPTRERDTLVLAMLDRMSGKLASIEWLDGELERVAANDSMAALDSELALVLWDEYRRVGTTPNYLHAGFAGHEISRQPRTLMVARLDGPTFEIAKSLVDLAVQAEKDASYSGRVYLDARGLSNLPNTPAEDMRYESSLLNCKEQLANRGAQDSFHVVLDTTPLMFQPGSCKDAIFYCGWYSPSKYINAFTFKPGAIAYHLSPGEVLDLKSRESQKWCKMLLTSGATATIGSVNETDMNGFPEPGLLFSDFVTSERSLVEVFFRYRRSLSDSTMLIGDPLFRAPR